MILYFSATGNTRFVAQRLAELLGDEALDLLDRIRRGDHSEFRSDRPFVICSPVYVCEPPRFLLDFLRQTPLAGHRSAYFVFTSGGYAGISGALAGSIVRRKGLRNMGCAELRMPRNYIANDTYPELSRAEIERRIADTSVRLPGLAAAIRRGERLKSRHVWLFEHLVTLPFNPVWCRLKQPTAPFATTDACVGCGRCARLCPLNAIQISNGRPDWIPGSCAHCMSCIQNCPTGAIEYGAATQGKQRYRFDKYRTAADVPRADAAKGGDNLDPR